MADSGKEKEIAAYETIFLFIISGLFNYCDSNRMRKN